MIGEELAFHLKEGGGAFGPLAICARGCTSVRVAQRAVAKSVRAVEA